MVFPMKTFYHIFFFCLFPCLFSPCADTPPLTAEEFLARARRPPGGETWAVMKGKTEHKRAGKDPREEPIRLGIQFTRERTRATLKLGAGEEYVVGQPYDETPATIVPIGLDPKKQSILADFGLRPEDLTMTFLFWKYKQEFDAESVRSQKCRVLGLENPQSGEGAKVFLSEQYYFPVKVEWIKPGEKTVYRTLEVSEVRRESDFWTVGELVLYGPGWKTRITFDDNKVGNVIDGMPKDVFMDANSGGK